MTEYRRSVHSVYDIKYHLVWITKYRKSVLTGKIAEQTRELIREICKLNDVDILAGYVSKKSYPSVGISAAPFISEQISAIYKGIDIKEVTDGI